MFEICNRCNGINSSGVCAVAPFSITQQVVPSRVVTILLVSNTVLHSRVAVGAEAADVPWQHRKANIAALHIGKCGASLNAVTERKTK